MALGVNRESILNSLVYFDVADECVLPDLMHDMLEGYLPYKTKLMLNYFIRYFVCLILCATNSPLKSDTE